MEKNVEINN